MNQRSNRKIWDTKKLYLCHMRWYRFLFLRHDCNILQSTTTGTAPHWYDLFKKDW